MAGAGSTNNQGADFYSLKINVAQWSKAVNKRESFRSIGCVCELCCWPAHIDMLARPLIGWPKLGCARESS